MTRWPISAGGESCRSMHVDVLTMHAITIRWTYFSTDSSSAQVRQMQSKPCMHAPRCLWVAICHLQGVTPGPERHQRHTISSWSVSTSMNSDLFSFALVIPLCYLLAFIIRPSRELRAPTTCLSAGGLDSIRTTRSPGLSRCLKQPSWDDYQHEREPCGQADGPPP